MSYYLIIGSAFVFVHWLWLFFWLEFTDEFYCLRFSYHLWGEPETWVDLALAGRIGQGVSDFHRHLGCIDYSSKYRRVGVPSAQYKAAKRLGWQKSSGLSALAFLEQFGDTE